jgi:EAL domain-containing protein (putative c-di-GMP-specific phosphodiesterase class I)
MPEGSPGQEEPALVLLVDDEPMVLSAYSKVLTRAGFAVIQASNRTEVEEAFLGGPFDVVISDIRMTDLSGLDVLREARKRDPDVAVILMTGAADLNTAVEAVENGASRFLLKPVRASVLTQSTADARWMREVARQRRAALEQQNKVQSEEQELKDQFNRALETLHMAYQPIVCWSQRRVFAHEALVRNGEPTLSRADLLIAAAEKQGRMIDLGREIRRCVAEKINETGAPTTFVNLHARELADPDLFSPLSPLSKVASRVVLELTERASLEKIKDPAGRLASLRSLGFRIAVDDLGSGHAGLVAFAELQPEVVKLDMSLVRAVDSRPTKAKLIATIIKLARELGIHVIAEGVETKAELKTLVGLGCDLFQGYLFAKPSSTYADVNFGAGV